MWRIDWLRVAVLVIVPLLAVLLFAHLEARRQIRALPAIGTPISGPEAKEAQRDHDAMRRGEVPEPE